MLLSCPTLCLLLPLLSCQQLRSAVATAGLPGLLGCREMSWLLLLLLPTFVSFTLSVEAKSRHVQDLSAA